MTPTPSQPTACPVCGVSFKTNGQSGDGPRNGCGGCGRHCVLIPASHGGDRTAGESIRSQNNSGSSETIPAAKLAASTEGGNLTRPPLTTSSAEEMEKAIDMVHYLVNKYEDETNFHLWCKLRHYIRTLEFENARLREALETLPEKLRESLDGHKGQAFRIATQLCDKALSPTTHD